MNRYPEDGGVTPWSNAGEYLYTCMGAAGYTLKSCKPSDAPRCYCKFFDRDRVVMPECYVPTGELAEWVYNVKMRLTGGGVHDPHGAFLEIEKGARP